MSEISQEDQAKLVGAAFEAYQEKAEFSNITMAGLLGLSSGNYSSLRRGHWLPTVDTFLNRKWPQKLRKKRRKIWDECCGPIRDYTGFSDEPLASVVEQGSGLDGVAAAQDQAAAIIKAAQKEAAAITDKAKQEASALVDLEFKRLEGLKETNLRDVGAALQALLAEMQSKPAPMVIEPLDKRVEPAQGAEPREASAAEGFETSSEEELRHDRMLRGVVGVSIRAAIEFEGISHQEGALRLGVTAKTLRDGVFGGEIPSPVTEEGRLFWGNFREGISTGYKKFQEIFVSYKLEMFSRAGLPYEDEEKWLVVARPDEKEPQEAAIPVVAEKSRVVETGAEEPSVVADAVLKPEPPLEAKKVEGTPVAVFLEKSAATAVPPAVLSKEYEAKLVGSAFWSVIAYYDLTIEAAAKPLGVSGAYIHYIIGGSWAHSSPRKDGKAFWERAQKEFASGFATESGQFLAAFLKKREKAKTSSAKDRYAPTRAAGRACSSRPKAKGIDVCPPMPSGGARWNPREHFSEEFLNKVVRDIAKFLPSGGSLEEWCDLLDASNTTLSNIRRERIDYLISPERMNELNWPKLLRRADPGLWEQAKSLHAFMGIEEKRTSVPEPEGASQPAAKGNGDARSDPRPQTGGNRGGNSPRIRVVETKWGNPDDPETQKLFSTVAEFVIEAEAEHPLQMDYSRRRGQLDQDVIAMVKVADSLPLTIYRMVVEDVCARCGFKPKDPRNEMARRADKILNQFDGMGVR